MIDRFPTRKRTRKALVEIDARLGRIERRLRLDAPPVIRQINIRLGVEGGPDILTVPIHDAFAIPGVDLPAMGYVVTRAAPAERVVAGVSVREASSTTRTYDPTNPPPAPGESGDV